MATELYDYQKKYLEGLPKNIIMSADTGVGKGQMSLNHYMRYGLGRPILIVCPASKAPPRSSDWHRELVMAFDGLVPDHTVVSYDKFARDPSRYYKPGIALICDELHYAANATTKRGKAVQKFMRMADQFIGLSATPLPNGWKSMENYAIMFGLSRNKTDFWNTYVRVDRSRGFPIILGYNHENRLKSFWNRVAKPLSRSEAADLPDKLMLQKSVVLMPDELAAYNAIKKTRVYNDELLDSPSKLFAALRQSVTPYRRDALIDILDGTSEHVVVFYNFNVERDMILDVLAKQFPDRTVYEQSGHASHLPPRSEWGRLKPSVTLAQYQSASTAIELTYASVTVYLSPTYSYSQYQQSIGRTHRNGQQRKTVFYHLNAAGTIDQAVWAALKEKRDFNENLYYEEVAKEG